MKNRKRKKIEKSNRKIKIKIKIKIKKKGQCVILQCVREVRMCAEARLRRTGPFFQKSENDNLQIMVLNHYAQLSLKKSLEPIMRYAGTYARTDRVTYIAVCRS